MQRNGHAHPPHAQSLPLLLPLPRRDGAKVATLEEFYRKVWARANPDDEVELTILQGSDIKTLTLRGVDRMTTMMKPAGI